MNIKRSMLIAICVALGTLSLWEFYLRSKGYKAELEDNKALWAVERSRVDYAFENDVVLLGDSRMHYDLQLDAWQEVTGKRPIQLGSTGTTPIPAFHDLVINTDFKGTVIMSIHPVIFYTILSETDFLWRRIQVRIDHYHDRTYAQRLNHILDIPLQYSFAFLRSEDESWADDLDLKTMLGRIRIGEREGSILPPFYRFQEIDLDRNFKMYEKVVTDTAFANTIKKVWGAYAQRGGPPPNYEKALALFSRDLEEFQARGGQVIGLRLPSSGNDRYGEKAHFPRENFWDRIIEDTGIPGYHFEDYSQLNQFICPEDSHLSAEDAYTFTTELAKIIVSDKHISPITNN